MEIPRLLYVADGFVTGRGRLGAASVRDRAVALVRAGVPWVSLRDHRAEDEAFLPEADRLGAALRLANPDVLLSVHGRLGAAREIGAGLHVGRRGATLPEAVAAGLAGPVGGSAHSPEAARAAAGGGAAYVTLSPIFPTRTHPEAAALGVGPLRRAAEQAGVPVLALGGVTPERARAVREAGAWGVAAITSLLLARDPARAVSTFLRALT